MQFAYTPEQLALRERAAALTEAIYEFELPCEAGRGLPPESLAQIRELTLAAELNAINMPTEWGGQGLPVLEQVIVSGAPRPAHQRAVGRRLAAGQRAAPLHRGPARAIPDPGDQRRPARLLRGHRGARRL